MKKHFDILLLIARPAAGKSEIIDFLKKTPITDRLTSFHIGDLAELDDFPILWRWFEEDDLLSEMGHERLYTDNDGYFLDHDLWNLLIRLISLDYKKALRDNPEFHETSSMIIEFSRGSEHGGFKEAFEHLSDEIIRKMVILYIDVPWEESLRKNRRRFNPEKPDSILEHGLPDKKMEKLYRDNDWEELSEGDPEYLIIKGHKVPYAVFDNRDDVTTNPGELFETRIKQVLQKLWEIRINK